METNSKLFLRSISAVALGSFLLIVLVSCGGALKNEKTARIANPASVHCVESGGSLIIQKREGGGEYGICVFPGGRQCEEWALFRGECPPGGISVETLMTPVARFCVITGGQYSEATDGGPGRSGICSFPNGRRCDAQDYYNGKCRKY